MDADPRYRGRLEYRQNRHHLEFDVAEGLFSAARVDAGTAFLLRWLGGPAFGDVRSVLDLGCGYGPLGIALARFDERRRVLGLDRDALAVDYTRRNAALNGVAAHVEARGSLGFDAVDPTQRYDLVASNLPAKIGPAALDHFLFGAPPLLSASGRVAVVVIDRLRDQVEQLLGEDADVVERHDNRGYGVFVYVPRRPPRAVEDPYARGAPAEFRFGSRAWTATPTYTLREFDTLAFATQEAMALVEQLEKPNRLVVVDVGHGHLAAFAAQAHPRTPIELVDRDLLALRVAATTLGGGTPHHTADPAAVIHAGDTVLVRLDERDDVQVSAAAIRCALPARTVLAYGRAADTSRAATLAGARVAAESRDRGHAAVLLTRR